MFNNFKEIRAAIISREVKGALVDAYVVGEYKEMFEDPRFRVQNIFDEKFAYGTILAGDSSKLDQCFRRYLTGYRAELFDLVASSVHQMMVKYSLNP